MEKAADAVFFKDLESRYIRVSNRMVGMFNMDHPTQVEGKTDFDFFTQEHAAATLEIEKEIMRSGLPKLEQEERETWPDGSITWASTSRFPLYDEEGVLLGLFGISRDITARKEAEEQLAAAQRVLIEQEKQAAVAEFAGTVMAIMGSSVIEIRQGLEKTTEQLRQAKSNPALMAEAQEGLKELRFVVQKLADLMKIQGGS